MSHTALTSGALARICRVAPLPYQKCFQIRILYHAMKCQHKGEDVHEPVLQVLGQKAITGSGQER